MSKKENAYLLSHREHRQTEHSNLSEKKVGVFYETVREKRHLQNFCPLANFPEIAVLKIVVYNNFNKVFMEF